MRSARFLLVAALAVVGGAAPLLWSASSRAASHSDAPLITQDPQANITDVYAFVGTKYDGSGQTVLNIITHVRPYSEPGDGPTYSRFADDALYSVHIANPVTGAEIFRFDFQFSDVNPLTLPGLKNPNTILSYGRGAATAPGAIHDIGDAQQNYTQAYTVKKTVAGVSTLLGGGLVPPPNVGVRTTPHYNDLTTGQAISGATSFAELDRYTQQGIRELSSGEAVFAGRRDDGFYADFPGLFDSLDPRIAFPSPSGTFGQGGGGVDGFKGYNTLAYAIQIPLTSLPLIPFAPPSFGGMFPGPEHGVGVYASVSRPRLLLRRTDGDPVPSGPFIQVNRMGNPLFNEVMVALGDKDVYNRTLPTVDATQFRRYAENPELAFLINFVFFGGSPVIQTTGRTDLSEIYIPDVIRVDLTTPPVTLPGQIGFSRLSFLGGDKVMASGGLVPGGWPNGRRLGDDVVDIAFTAIASGPAYNPIVLMGDNVAANDQVYHQVFPYAATPHAGPRHSKDSGINAGH